VVVIKVGALSELEMNERRDRLDDSLHATRCAEKEGVVPGGGVALLRCWQKTSLWSRLWNRVQRLTSDEVLGEEILRQACLAPLITLCENAGESPSKLMKPVLKNKFPSFGWNARTGEYGDMIEMGVIDPLRVVRVALESAASVAGLMLVTNCLVANERK